MNKQCPVCGNTDTKIKYEVLCCDRCGYRGSYNSTLEWDGEDVIIEDESDTVSE